MRKYLLPSLFVGVVFFWVWGGVWNEIWMQRWVLVTAGFAAYIAYYMGKRSHVFFAPIICTTLFSGIVSSMWFTRYSDSFFNLIAEGVQHVEMDKWAISAVMRQDASRATTVFLVLLFALATLPQKTTLVMRRVLALFGLVYSYVLITQKNAGSWVPFFDNPSMAGCYVALTVWTLDGIVSRAVQGRWLWFARALVWVPCSYAIVLTQASAPLLTLAGGGVGYAFSWSLAKGRRLWLLALPLPALAAWGMAALSQKSDQIFNSNSRLDMWAWFFDFWNRHDAFTHWFGFGVGTSRAFMPLSQVEHGANTGWYFYLHNDWLQVLFEQGYLGFAALILASVTVAWLVRTSPPVLATFTAFGACMLVNFPLHWPVHALFLTLYLAPFFYMNAEVPVARFPHVLFKPAIWLWDRRKGWRREVICSHAEGFLDGQCRTCGVVKQ